MPGYLSHLAARAFGVKAAVRPRLPSLFESAPGTKNIAAPEGNAIQLIEQERVAPQPVPAAAFAPPPRSDTTRSERSAPLVVHEDRTPTRKQTKRIVEPETRKVPAETTRQTIQSSDAALEPVPMRMPSAVATRREPRAIEVAEDVTPAPQKGQRLMPSTESKAEQQVPNELPFPVRMQPHFDEPRREAAPLVPERQAVAAAKPTSLTPVIAPAPEPRPAQRIPAAADPVPQESPSIQVTIGRLIVEAVMPAPAVAAIPASRPQAPRLSLDDYLRQRRSQL